MKKLLAKLEELGSAHESWSLHDSFAYGPEVLAALAESDAPHSRKSCMCLPQ